MSKVVTIGDATLILGDCRELLTSLPDFAAVVTDPPYGMSYKSGHNSGRRGAAAQMVRKDGNFEAIEGDQEPFDPSHLLALAKPTIMWGAQYYCDRLQPGTRWLVWDKLAGKAPFPSGADVELAWTSEPGPSRLYTHLWRGIMRAGEENVANGGKLHPHQKPVNLMQWSLSFVPAGPILDPYMGSASIGVACFRAHRPYIGIEKDPRFFDIAVERLAGERQLTLALDPAA